MALLRPLAGLDASLLAPRPQPLKMGTDCHSFPLFLVPLRPRAYCLKTAQQP